MEVLGVSLSCSPLLQYPGTLLFDFFVPLTNNKIKLVINTYICNFKERSFKKK